jgi:clan AA aspartic protease (TIGR02281 family)
LTAAGSGAGANRVFQKTMTTVDKPKYVKRRINFLYAQTGFALLLICGAVHGESIPLIRDHGNFAIPVLINGSISLNFTVDSGASDVSIPADVFSTLTRAGTVTPNDLMETRVYTLADGSKKTSQLFRIRSLKIGAVELRDVVGSVAPAAGPLLLGQSFLSRVQSWSIDNQQHVLLINQSRPLAAAVVLPSQSEQPIPDSRWFSLTKSQDGSQQMFVDAAHVHIAGDIRQAWIKTDLAPHTRPGSGENASKWQKMTMALTSYNCTNQTVSMGAFNIYYDDGTVFSSDENDSSGPWRPVPPGTMLNTALEFICGI